MAITSRTARRWLIILGFTWKDIKKGVFFDGHEREDVVEYRTQFLQAMEEMLPYMVEFNEDGTMKEKQYPEDCSVGGPNRRPIIMITHDESIFSAHDGRHQAWISERGMLIHPKGKGKGIMVSDFLLPWSRLNLSSLSKERQTELEASGLPREAAVLFEYGKEDGYWDGSKLLEQVLNQALPIAESLYPGYQLLFLFDNATSHSVYADDALQASKMNKGEGGAQAILRDGWYKNGDTVISQKMFYESEDALTGTTNKIPKGIQKVLEERGLWLERLNLMCSPPLCNDCSDTQNCKNCAKGKRCEGCKKPKVHSSKCTPKRICDNCELRKQNCQCTRKQLCPRCDKRRKEGCKECESLPPKCNESDSQLAFC
jgi:hypothetical protein